MKLYRFCLLILVAALVFTFLFTGCRHHKKQQPLAKNNSVSNPRKNVPVKEKTDSKHASDKIPAFHQKVGISVGEVGKNKLYAFINEWYGVPYKYGGCQKTGIDCSCFTNLLYEEVYGKRIARSASEIFKACNEISVDDAKEGDMVFFKIGGKNISHVGVYIRNTYFVHSSASEGVAVNSLREAYYQKYFFCAGKMNTR